MEKIAALLGAAVYLGALAPLVTALGREARAAGSTSDHLRSMRGAGDVLILLLAAGLHAVALAWAMRSEAGFQFGFAPAISAMTLLAVLFFAIESTKAPIGLIRLVLYPAAALGVLLPLVFPGKVTTIEGEAPFVAHLTLAMVSYGLLSLAALHALAMALIDYALHDRQLQGQRGGWASTLLDLAPPLLAMERLLFRALGIGFLLLTLTLISGIGFHEQLFGKPLSFDHKTVFSIASWVTFGVLLFGRWRYGWRGRLALRYVFSGFAALVLAYIGTQFVFEVLLHRH